MSNGFDNQCSLRETEHVETTSDRDVPSVWQERLVSPQRIAEMSEGNHKGPSKGGPAAPGSVESLAAQVLSLVASKPAAPASRLDPVLLSDLVDAVAAFDPAKRDVVMAQFRAAGVPDHVVVDHYIPAAARHYGESWCSANMSFADVAIGVARLQGMTRDLATRRARTGNAATVLLIVPQDAYHTLGASVLADQIRRLGVSVKLSLGHSVPELQDLLETHHFDAVMISAAACERLDSIRKLVKTVKANAFGAPPVVVGGTVLDQETDIRTLTGADHISNNAQEALRLCGLMIRTPDAVSPVARD